MSSVSRNLCPFKAHFIYGNSQKSFGAKSGEYGGCSISVIDFIDFWARNGMTAPGELEQCHDGEFS
jgi:hypothetical protein